MGKFVSVASQYTIYEVEDEAFELLPNGTGVYPPQIVLEVMVVSGTAKRVATVGTLSLEQFHMADEDEMDPEDGEGPWLED